MNRYRLICALFISSLLLMSPLFSANVALGHGWVTQPPSRQDHCAKGTTSFDCGPIKYEPQSVEAPKGSMLCSGGSSFRILDDNSRPWPVTNINSTVTIQWRLTAAHSTSTWEYFVDGRLHTSFNQGGRQPPSNISHTLTGLPSGRHTILARWNIADTAMAFYNCIDVNVGGSGTATPVTRTPTPVTRTPTPITQTPVTRTPTPVTRTPTPVTTTPGTCSAPAWKSGVIYETGAVVSHIGRQWRANFQNWNIAPGPTTDHWNAWQDLGPCGSTATPVTGTPTPVTRTPTPVTRTPTPVTQTPITRTPTPVTQTPTPGGKHVIGYFAQWGVYDRKYHVKNIVTSGSASKLTHINYAFGNVTGGKCVIGDAYADYDRFYSAAESVDGVADTWDTGALRGSFNQLRKLKKMYPNIKVLWSFGGWTWSGGFGQAAANPAAFAESCYNLVNDPRWAGVFDGIDIDWEYPNACGLTCDTSGFSSFKNLMSALRARFGSQLVTAAITADASSGGKIDAADYGGAAQFVDWYLVMTYDFFGAWSAQGPTAPHSPLYSYPGIPQDGFNTDAALQKLKSKGVPSSKLLLGIGFYGRGWTGVTQSAPGGSATGPAPGTYEQGIEDYKVLVTKCPSNGTIAGTAYAHCGTQWWSYDTPNTINGKMSYAKSQGLGGAFFWELSGDTSNGTLITAMANGLQ